MKSLPYLLFFTFIFLSCDIKSQDTGYLDGYVITNKEDTLMGRVKYKNFVPFMVYEKIRFINVQGKKEKYSPDDIKGFRLGPDFYYSKKVYYYSEHKFLFVKEIIRGCLSFYIYTENSVHTGHRTRNTIEHVILEKKKEKKQLIFGANPRRKDFKEAMVKFLKDVPELCEKITSEIYDSNELEQIVTEYNKSVCLN